MDDKENYRLFIEMRPFIQKTFRTPNSETKHARTNRQTNICLQKIYVEGPVQNNDKSKIENVVSIILDGPLREIKIR